ncbi:MAG: InlB B-repeat-containing protein, partial [Clostridia bacterium]|nr:InlB B-repeat-containing protein [Clostridia bacterium]
MMKKRFLTFLCGLSVFCVFGAFSCGGNDTPSVSVTFDYGCEIADYTQTVDLGGTVQMPNKPKRDGYVFLGWFEKDESGNLKETAFDFIETPASDGLILYAKWVEAPKDMQKPPEKAELSYLDGVLTVVSEDDVEISFNGGEYGAQASLEVGESERVKVSVRKIETQTHNYSEPIELYYSTVPDLSKIVFSPSPDAYSCVLTSVTGEDIYEYKFEKDDEWQTGAEFFLSGDKAEQSVSVRLRADGNYPASAAVETTCAVRLDPERDTLDDISYIWGGSVNTSSFALNTDAEGLLGAESRQSIKIEDFDITGYNDWAIKIPAGFTAYSADVKVVLKTTATITKDLPVTNGTGEYLGVIKLNTWQKFYGYNGDWIFTLNFPSLNTVNKPTGTATVYLDNIVYYTQAEVDGGVWNANRFVDNSNGTGDGDAVADLETKFDITLGTNGSLYKNYKNRYVLQTKAASVNGNHVIKIKAPKIKDVSKFGGISVTIDLQMAGSG